MLKILIKHIANFIYYYIVRNRRSSDNKILLILMYHRILPAEESVDLGVQPGMYVDPQTLDMHINEFRKYFTIIPLKSWVKAKRDGTIDSLPDFCCAITFDDGWKDNYQYAYPVLLQNICPATIFLVTDMIGTNRRFWQDMAVDLLMLKYSIISDEVWNSDDLRIIRLISKGYKYDYRKPTIESVVETVSSLRQYSDQTNVKMLEKIYISLGIADKILSGDRDIMNWNEVAEMSESDLIDWGSHTANHIRLNANTDRVDLHEEIEKSAKELEIKLNSNTISGIFCYPNGEYTDKSVQIVKNNYSGAVTTDLGWNDIDDDLYHLKRIGVHQDISSNKYSFFARIFKHKY